jgi:polysaccharide export outer membrane protein
MLLKGRSVSINLLLKLCAFVCLTSIVAITPSYSQQKLETADQTNARIRDMARSLDSSSGDYRIGGGDLINVDVFDVPQLSRDVRVTESGFIALPLLPVRVQAKGLTGAQLEQKLEELLAANGLVTHPQVTVTIKEQRSQPITVIGAVKSPQVIQASRPMSLVEILTMCGGIAENAGDTVLITHPAVAPVPTGGNLDLPGDQPQPQTIKISLNDLLDNVDPKNNIMLTGGDSVTVPRAGIIYVVGAVNHPGGFVLQNDSQQMTTLKAIAMAQGTLPSAKANEAVILRKDPATGKDREIPVDLQKVMRLKTADTTLMANDVLFVPDSNSKRAMRRVGDIVLSLTTGVALVRASR